MISLKLMETRTQRDGMVLAFISYFLVLTNYRCLILKYKGFHLLLSKML